MKKEKRIRKFFKEGFIGENIYKGDLDSKKILLNWLIDDGRPARPFRKNLFNTSFDKIGIYCNYTHDKQVCVVIDFAGEDQFIEEDDEYKIDVSEWPSNTNKIEKKVVKEIFGDHEKIIANYTFTLYDGTQIHKTKEFPIK